MDQSKESVYKRKIEGIINDNGLKPLVKDYNRVTKIIKTVIDQVLTNMKYFNSNISSTNKISDHEIIEIRIKNVNYPKVIRKGVKIFKYRMNIFQREINNTTYSRSHKLLHNAEIFCIFKKVL